MQLGNVITAFSNQTLHTPSVPTWVQKHSLLLALWHLIPPSPFPPLGALSAGRAKEGGRCGGSCVPESIPVHSMALPIPEHFPVLGGAAPMVLQAWQDTDLGSGITLLRLPAHRGTRTPRTSSCCKGCFLYHVHILHCQSCSNKLHISLQHTTNSVI